MPTAFACNGHTAMFRLLPTLLLLAIAPLALANPGTEGPASATSSAKPRPKVTFNTNKGAVTIQLYPDKSPKSVDNFLQYAQSGFYTGTVFHRVIDDFLVQGGLYTRQLRPKRTRDPVPAEADNGLSNVRGTVAVARGGDPDSGTSQFFINLVDNRRLDYVDQKGGLTWGYTVFGRVVAGMDVVDAIGDLPTHAQGPFAGDVPDPLVVITDTHVSNVQADTATAGSASTAAASSAPAAAASSAASATPP